MAKKVTMTEDDLLALLAKARAEGAADRPTRKVSWKVGEKGNLVISFGSRWPMSFYISQWDVLMASLDDIKKFVADNRTKFATKTND
jgi:hypothetical protein